MVGTSKILTVSYGTFSCTLEGFDDSFNTMKAIAEYFRDLAADDRYFGAEPPTPDAEMLARIAEREISRRVDARMDGSDIVLRATALEDQRTEGKASSDDETATPDAEAEAARLKAEAKAAKKAKAAAKAEAKAQAEAKAKAEEAEAIAKAETEAKAQAEAAAEAQRAADEAEAERLIEEEAARVAALQEAEATEEASDEEDAVLGAVAAATTANDAPAVEADVASEAQAPARPVVPAHPDADSVAAKLQRIRAVVSNSDDDEGETADYADDLNAQFLPQSDAPEIADTAEQAEDAIDADDALAEFDALQDDLVQENEEQTAEDVVDYQDDTQDEVEAQDAVEDVTAAPTDMIARVMSRQSEAPAEAADDAEADEESDVAEAAEDTAPEAGRNVRVTRMKRADFEAAVADGTIEVDTADAAQDATPAPDFGLLDGADELDSYLEDSDFDDAAMSLDTPEDLDLDDASLDDDMDVTFEEASEETDQAEQQDVAEDAKAEAEESQTPSAGFLSDDADGDALDRLMGEADAQMEEPEGNRRRNAIAQLKAAVAAKEAARKVGEDEDDDQDVENAFRNDLSEAKVRPVAPRHVERGATRTERPRAAPLKLVAAQRVDLEGSEPSAPVTPRRVQARQDMGDAQASGSFADFAEKMDAKELPDLLEAAAAYTSFVEGAGEFSRPQILRRVRAVASEEFNREEGLRSFAVLLKEGRFTKVRNGRFQVADDSRFNPERRAG